MDKIMVTLLSCLAINGCAIGEMADEIEAKLTKVDNTLNDLHTAECIRVCSDEGELCLDDANGLCVDSCEVERDACDTTHDACMDQAVNCSVYQGQAYINCVNAVEEACDQDCDGHESNCNQECGDVAQECLETNADCVADCVQELEDSLKDLNLND